MSDIAGREPWSTLPDGEFDKLDADGRLAYKMGELAAQFAAQQQDLGVVLDYSPQSLELLEDWLEYVYAKLPRGFFSRLLRRQPSEDEIYSLAIQYGSYLGEVIRRNLGLQWSLTHPSYPGEQDCFMLLGSMAIAPVSKVFKRLADGPSDEVPPYYRFIEELLNTPDSAD